MWYLNETAREGWNVRQLERNINSFYYQRHLDINENARQRLANSNEIDTRQFIKDPYVLEFVGLPGFYHYEGIEYPTSILQDGIMGCSKV